MPYKSQAQQRYMHAQNPKIAERWDKKYGVPKDLPERTTDRRDAYKRARDSMS